MDLDDEDEGQYRVKEVATARRNVPQRAPGDWEDKSQVTFTIMGPLIHDTERSSLKTSQHSEPSTYHRNMESWARQERNSRSGGAGRTGSAVTGLTKSKLGGGSVMGQRGRSSGSKRVTDHRPAKLSKAPSALSAVSSRRERFG